MFSFQKMPKLFLFESFWPNLVIQNANNNAAWRQRAAAALIVFVMIIIIIVEYFSTISLKIDLTIQFLMKKYEE